MKTLFFLFSCLLSVTCVTSIHSQLPPATYVGYVSLPDATYYLEIEHSVDTTFVKIPELFAAGPFTPQWKADGFGFTYQYTDWNFVDIQPAENGFTGRLYRAGLAGHFHLFPVAEKMEEALNNFAHAYRLPNGEYINVWEQSGRLSMHAALSGKVSRLQPIGQQRFFSSAGEMVTFSDKSADGFRQISYRYLGSDAVQANYAPSFTIERHEIPILGDTVGLSLYLPAGERRSPACIIPMGAANYERWIYILEARILATHGIATLIYDNYGMGQSSGTSSDKTFQDKKNQLLALYDWLSKHPKINEQQIGFRGGSQGGRLSLMAAAEQPQTAFVIALSAPLGTRLDQQLYAYSQYHRRSAFAEDAIARNTDVWRRYFEAVKAGKADNELVRAANALRTEYPRMALPALEIDRIPRLPTAADLSDRGSDYLESVECPVLALYGALDDLVPAQKSAEQLHRGLQAAGKAPATIIIYDNANHSFLLPGRRIVPGLFMDQVRFVKAVLRAEE